ncbi:MAG: adenylate cyclase [Actinomycetota bacterium]
MTTSQTSGRLSDGELSRLLSLVQDADSVELKLTLPESDRQSALAALEVDPLDARIRQVYFFDTPELSLFDHGVVARARRTQGKPDDSVVKLRPVVPSELSNDLRKDENFVVEVDAMPGGYVCSASYKGSVRTGRVKETVAQGHPLDRLFSKQQRVFFADHAPEGVKLDSLSILGPITVLKLKVAPDGFARKMAVELWNYPDGSRILELSTKCAPSEAFQVAAESRAFLSDRGVNLEGEQETKTKTALYYYAATMRAS